MVEPKINIMGGLIIIALVLSGVTITWMFTEKETVLERNGEVLGIHRWHVEAERTYINKNSWYRTNIMCPKIIEMGGYETATRCYYPSDYYEMLSRSNKRTNLEEKDFIVERNTPQYAYGTRGAYAGYLDETFIFKDTDKAIDFPTKYEVAWAPKDTRNYKLVWRVWDIKDMNLEEGNYNDCSYTFGNLKIDLKEDCSKLDRAEVKDDRIWFYFNPERGEQTFDLTFVDPPSIACDCPSVDENLLINLTTNCVTNSTCDLGTGILSFNDTGTWYCNDTIRTARMVNPIADQKIIIEDNCYLNITG